MGLDIFKEDVSSIKIRKNDYQNKVDEVIDYNNDISIASLNLLEMEEEKNKKDTYNYIFRGRRIKCFKGCIYNKKYNSS